MNAIKCTECLTEHPKPDWPWKKYSTPVYWDLKDDGAFVKCRDCKKELNMADVILTQIPCGHRLVVCRECVDEYWISIAKHLGVFRD